MAFGTPYFLGHVAGGSGVSQQMTVGQQTLIGDSIIVCAGNSSAAGATITGVADSVGNVYNACAAATTVNQFGQVWAAVYGFSGPGTPTGALTTSDVITVTFSTTSGQKMVTALACTGIISSASAVDAAASAHSTSTAMSVTSAALNSTPEMAIGVLIDQSTGGQPSSIGGTGTWTEVGTFQTGTTPYVTAYYQSVSATTALTLSASITSSNWAAFIITFEEGPAPASEPYSLGTANSAAGADTLQLTVAASSATGDALIVATAINSSASAASPSACADSQGNLYSLVVATGAGNEYQTTIFVATCWSDGVSPTVALTDGVDTITVTYSTSVAATGHNLSAIGCSGLAVGPASSTVDQSVFAGNTTTGTAIAATLGATQETGELVVAAASTHNTGNALAWTLPLVNITQPCVNGGNEQTFIGAGLNTTTVSTSYGGTLNSTGKWDVAVISILPLSAGPISGVAALTAQATLAALGTIIATASMTAQGTLTALATQLALASLDAVATLTAASTIQPVSAMDAVATLSADSDQVSASQLTATASLVADGTLGGTAVLDAVITLMAASTLRPLAQMNAASSLTAASRLQPLAQMTATSLLTTLGEILAQVSMSAATELTAGGETGEGAVMLAQTELTASHAGAGSTGSLLLGIFP
jgi:hypothetical protein